MRRLISIAFFLVCFDLLGQGQKVNESFIIQKNKELSLPTFEKQIFGDNDRLDLDRLVPKYRLEFDTLSNWSSSELSIAKVNSRFIPSIKEDRNHKSHLAWGSIGNRLNTNFGYQFLNPVDQKRRINFNVGHRSIRIGPTEDVSSAQNGQETRFQIVQPTGSWVFDFESNLSRQAFNYFGVLHPSRNTVELNTSVESALLFRTDHELELSNYSSEKVKLSAKMLHQSTNQSKLNTSSEQRYGVSAFIAGKASNQLSWVLSPTFDFIYLTPQLIDSDRMMTQVPVKIDYAQSDWKVQLGLNWVYNRNVIDEDGKSYVLPTAIFSYNLGNLRSLNIGLKSSTRLNTVFNTSRENLYLNYVSQDYRSSIYQAIWFANYHHTLANKHHFSLEGSYAQVRDRAFFVENSLSTDSIVVSESASYSLVYDQQSIGHFRIRLSGNGKFNDQLYYDFSIQGNRFFLSSLEQAFHEPTFSSNFGLSYRPIPKIKATTQFKYDAGLRFSEIEESGQVANLILELDYQLNQQFSSFISCNNILNQSNTRYYLYPSSPFLISAGLKALF